MDKLYHIGFGRSDLGIKAPKVALLSGDPARAKRIADTKLSEVKVLSENRGLYSYLGFLGEIPVVSATSGMGAPSLSIIVNELIQVGITTIIRVGTCGSIQDHVKAGSVVISSAALTRQGAANDVAPTEYPAVADPFLTVTLAESAKSLKIDYHVGITASVDSFYEGQGRTGSANPNLIRAQQGVIEEYQNLNILNFEMEAGTLFKMASVYGFKAACICAVIAERQQAEDIVMELKDLAVSNAIDVAIASIKTL